MSETLYIWAMRTVVVLYGVSGVASLFAHEWQRAAMALLLGVVNYLIFF